MSTPRPDKAALSDPSYHWAAVKARAFIDALVAQRAKRWPKSNRAV
jgi:hypothetical protein